MIFHSAISVPITTSTCIDCNPLDEKDPPKQVRCPMSYGNYCQL